MNEAVQIIETPPAEAPIAEAPAQDFPRPLAPRGLRKGEGLLAGVQSLALTLVIAIFAITFLAQAFQIPSHSMEKTLLIGDYLLVDKLQFAPGGAWESVLPYQDVQRGEIIVFRYPANPQQHFVKRVVAVPGDRLRLRDRQLYVNGTPVKESYALIKGQTRDSYRDNFPDARSGAQQMDPRWWSELDDRVHAGELVVPHGAYFVLGDNRDESYDSRYWGFVPRENIIGRPMVIYLSVQRPDQSGMALPDDTLSRLAYTLAHLHQFARWDRVLRLVK